MNKFLEQRLEELSKAGTQYFYDPSHTAGIKIGFSAAVECCESRMKELRAKINQNSWDICVLRNRLSRLLNWVNGDRNGAKNLHKPNNSKYCVCPICTAQDALDKSYDLWELEE